MKNTIYYLLSISVGVLIFGGCKKTSIPPPVTPAPTISAINPTTGLAGVQVTISGSNFSTTAADNTVKFNGGTATIVSATTTTLVVNAPAAGSTGAVSVATSGGTASGPVFTYLQAPTITSISPTSAPIGATVTINGTNFDATTANNAVKFNGTAATIKTASATQLTVTVPTGGSSGAITVTTAGGTATSAVFTYLQPPVITSVAPASASIGATVTLTGTGFDAVAANNTVKFNTTTATIKTASATQLVVTVPTGANTENITVTTTVGTSAGVAFTYIPAVIGPNVYVMGADSRNGYGYWKNSTFTAIPDCNSEYAMIGIGSDTYIAGPSTSNTPTYWKNGTAVHLSNQTGYTFSAYASGNDLYFLGNVNGVYYVWKNGTPTALQTSTVDMIGQGYYLGNNIAVSNGNVYVAGAQYLGQSTILKATYWKNGVPIDITDGIKTGSATANAICVSGGDIYVAGIEEIRDPVTNGIITRAPRLWKNGVSIPMSAPINSLFNSVSSILVVGSDVYVGGQYNGAGVVWKNGTIINAAGYAVAENVSSLFLYNNTDVYATGASSSSGENGYWKNGNFVEMDPGCRGLSSNCANTSSIQSIGIYVK